MSEESEARPITLEMIERHLRKQDRDAVSAAFLHPMALGAAIILAGITLTWPCSDAGIGLFILGILYFCWVCLRFFQHLSKRKY